MRELTQFSPLLVVLLWLLAVPQPSSAQFSPVADLRDWMAQSQPLLAQETSPEVLAALRLAAEQEDAQGAYDQLTVLIEQHAGSDLDPALRFHLGQIALHARKDHPTAIEQLTYATEHLDPARDANLIMAAHSSLLTIHYWDFEMERVLRGAEAGMEVARRVGNRNYESEFLLWMGRAMDAREFHDEALPYYYQSLDISQSAGDSSLIYQAYDNIASTHYKRGASEEGLVWLERAGPYIVLDKQRAGVALWRGIMLSSLGRFEEAERSLFASRDLYDEIKDVYNPGSRMHVRFELGKNYLNAQDYPRAVAMAEDAFAVDPDNLGPFDYRYGYWLLSEAHQHLGNYRAAYENLNNYFRWEAHVDSISNLQNLQELTTRYETKEQARLIEQQRDVIANRWWLGVALGFAILFLGIAGLGLFHLYRTRSHLAEQKRTIEEQTTRLRELDRMKSNFFANISHELRTPLTLIQGPIQSALRSEQLDARHNRMLRRAQDSAKSLHELVESILALTKLEARQLRTTPRPVRLHELVQRTALLFESYAVMRDIQYTFRTSVDEQLTVELDDRKLTVILNNLLSNALKYSSAGDSVRFEVDATAGELHFRVRDTGRGISTEDQQCIFDRYYQAKTSTQGGAGIGLAMVREFSELMGGSVRVESEVGKGSDFLVVLPKTVVVSGTALEPTPLVDAFPAENVAVESATNGISDPSASVLLVEDNPGIRDYLQTLLAPHYQVVEKANGARARDWLRQQPEAERPDLIISDVMMPEMDGFELLNWLKDTPDFQTLPVIMLTARADADDKLRALRTGVDDYLLKPFVEEELLARVANLIGNHRVRREARRERLAAELSATPIPLGAALPEATTVVETPTVQPAPPLFREDLDWLELLETTVWQNLTNSNYSVVQLALDLATSERTLRRRLRQLVGLSPAKYLKAARLERARKLLEAREYRTVAQVAAAVGLRDAGAFSRSFQREYGKSPGEYL